LPPLPVATPALPPWSSVLTPLQVLLKLPALRPRISSPLLTARMRVLPLPRAPASKLLLAQPPRLLPPSTLTVTLSSSSPASTCPPLLPLLLSTPISPPLPSLLLEPEQPYNARDHPLATCALQPSAFTSIARDRMLSLRDSLLVHLN
jgi:hypothetical protein